MPDAFDDPEVLAQLNGPTVRVVPLVMFDFLSGPVRLWPGSGALLIEGNLYQGTAALGSLSATTAGVGMAIEELTLSLSGPPDMLANIRADTKEAMSRSVFEYLQFFSMKSETDWQPIASPLQVFWGTMGAPEVSKPKARDHKEQRQRTISIRAVNAMKNRRRPPYGFFSHRDQKARSVGGNDNLFINTSRMANATAIWPNFP